VDVSNGVLVYSMWNGYREKPQMQAFLDGCVDLGLKIVTLHTTGHADAATIQQLIDHTAPKKILPIHTEVPLWFEGSRNV
jgi:ribonuclease J